MSMSDLTLDDRSFQELVSEARQRVAERCPEWTEHNVSDPGITLIETFAWMTDMLVYRLNQVPDKLHVALLEMLGIKLAPPEGAGADVRFRLVESPQLPVLIPGRQTEVAKVTAPGEEPVAFRVRDDFTIPDARPVAYVLQRSGVLQDVGVAGGVARPSGTDQPAFSAPPQVGDALYLGFDESLDRLVLRVEVVGSRARGIGVEPASPPLCWEASRGPEWETADVLEDTTGGFNEAGGRIEVQLPRKTAPTTVGGRHLHWLRCRVTQLTRFGRPSPRFTEPPRIDSITARPTGALVRAEHTEVVVGEVLGESDGTPGQTFKLRNAPTMEPGAGEGLEVLDPLAGEPRLPEEDGWEQWERVESFADSEPDDRHYLFDAAAGEVELGPAIRTRREGWRQYGLIPPKGARLRMSSYRHGGGRGGSVPRDTLRQLRNPVAGVAEVTNPLAADGGVDAESLAAARRRAAYELRTRYRAVTAEDFEFLAGEAPMRAARALCLEPAPGKAIPVFILPPAVDPERPLTQAELTPSPDLLESVADFLDERRLMGTRVHVMPVPLRGVTVVVDVAIARWAHVDVVEREIKEGLYHFINPLVGGSAHADDGWAFGRPLNAGELYALVQHVPGVDRIHKLRMYETDPRSPDTPDPRPAGTEIVLAPNELVFSGSHRVRARRHDDR
jgi:predicted phage baseplate assembly protein